MNKNKKLKLIFPLWRGGNNLQYYFGSMFLNLIFPLKNSFIEKHINIETNNEHNENDIINNQTILLKELFEAKRVIEETTPDKIIVLGGDCLISQQPINYLNSRYDDLCVIWFDAHPDISTFEIFNNAHAMVIANLLGENQTIFQDLVDKKLNFNQIMYMGLNLVDANNFEKNKFKELKLLNIENSAITNGNFAKLNTWIKNYKFKKVYIHIDLDVLDPNIFHSLYFSPSELNTNKTENIARGTLTFAMLNDCINHISNQLEIVGLSISEFLPWDLKNIEFSLKNIVSKM